MKQTANMQLLQKGFTLLEMVVSVAIVALVATVLSQVFISTLRSNTKTEILKDMKQNGELALENMMRMIQNAQHITSTCESTGTSSQSITVLNPDGEETELGCLVDGSITRLASTSAEGTDYLTSSNVTAGGTSCEASSIEFVCKGGAGVAPSITISFQLAQTGTAMSAFEQASVSFQTSVNTRNINKE